MRDRFDRPLTTLRLSVTDRCNLRCHYCMPEENYLWLEKDELLTFEELSQLVDHFLELGLERVRITGGEPLLRKDLPVLVKMLAAKPLQELAMTTNGIRLRREAPALFQAGLSRLTVSLDTLRQERFERLARRKNLDQVLEGIRSVAHTSGLKLDMVVVRGENDDELQEMLAFASSVGAELRFIEYMDVGGATRWHRDRVVPKDEILDRVGPVESAPAPPSAPARRYVLPSGQVFGVVASVSEPFCRSCDRARITADGRLFLCLYATAGHDLRGLLRSGQRVGERIRELWALRADRGAEERAARKNRGVFIPLEELKNHPHLEMHKKGG